MRIEDELLRGAPLFTNLHEPDGRIAMKNWEVDPEHPWTEVVPEGLINQTYNFVVTEEKRLIVGRLPLGIGTDDSIGHPVLANFGLVYSAGDFRIEEGAIVEIRDSSGHYQTGPQGLRVAQLIFRLYGAPVAQDCTLTPYAQKVSRRERNRG